MITEEEWDRMFLNLAPVAFGASSLVLGLMMLTRSSSLRRRVSHLDGQYLVSVRYPGQWRDIREFVQPDNPGVRAIYSQFGPDPWGLYDFVCRNINYRTDVGEFWKFPSEVLQSLSADCEDTAILLTSLLRAGQAPNCYVALGNLEGYGHAWCQLDEQILETTFTSARVVPNPQDYCAYALFNDRDIVELWPGALGEVFELGRDEVAKLNLMAKTLEAL